MTERYENLNIMWGALMVEELVRNGITYFCISPGSRSTPLTLAAARNAKVRSIICYDERGAAFHALGYARASGQPAVLIATSGTAIANYLPAVVEASLDRVPLIILSADRPPEFRDSGANQTIRQPGIFGDNVRWEFDMPCPTEKIPPEMVLTTVDQALHRARRSPAGPVAVNCQFREPLAPLEEKISEEYLRKIAGWQHSGRPYTRYFSPRTALHPDEIPELGAKISETERGLLVVGRLQSAAEQQAVRRLAEKLQWPVFADVLSGLRLGEPLPGLLTVFDQLLLSGEFRARLRPQMILHIGGVPVSKRYRLYVEEFPPPVYLHVADHPFRHDPSRRITHRPECGIAEFCQNVPVAAGAAIDETWQAGLLRKNRAAEERISRFLAKTETVNEMAVARDISQEIPPGHGLYLASSLPVREMDMFASRKGSALPAAANRGASGIDGTIASASGFAAGLGRPVTLLTGDLAFLHDLNSLLLVKSIAQPLVIVLLNNQGGGIFSFLPIAGFPEVFEKYFATPHSLTFGKAAELFGIDYRTVTGPADFRSVYRQVVDSGRAAVIEVRTGREKNYRFQQELQQEILAAVESGEEDA